MLVSILANLVMVNEVNPISNESGDGFRRSEAYENIGDNEINEKRFKRLRKEDEEMLSIIQAFLISKN